MADHSEPAFDLSDIHEKAKVGFIHFRRQALDDAGEMGFDRYDIIDCVLALSKKDFHKSMDAENPFWKGCRQDVYKVSYAGEEIYLKLQ